VYRAALAVHGRAREKARNCCQHTSRGHRAGYLPGRLLTIVNYEIMECGPMRARHSKKEINEVLDYADDLGLCIVQTKAGHKWGRLECAESHKKSIWSTQRTQATMRVT
jgi:hypothetical protein